MVKAKILFGILLSTVYYLLFTPYPAFAQVDIGKEFSPPLYNPDPNKGIEGVGTLVSTLLANAYIIAGVLLLLFILLGGLNMIAGAGSRDAQKAAQSKQAVTWAVLGFLIIFASYWIIQVVQTITGIKITQ